MYRYIYTNLCVYIYVYIYIDMKKENTERKPEHDIDTKRQTCIYRHRSCTMERFICRRQLHAVFGDIRRRYVELQTYTA